MVNIWRYAYLDMTCCMMLFQIFACSSAALVTSHLWNYTFFVMWVIALEEFQVENTTCSWRHNSNFLQTYKSTDVAVRCILLSSCDCHIIHFLNVKPVMFLDWSTLNVKYLIFFSVVQSRQGHAVNIWLFEISPRENSSGYILYHNLHALSLCVYSCTPQRTHIPTMYFKSAYVWWKRHNTMIFQLATKQTWIDDIFLKIQKSILHVKLCWSSTNIFYISTQFK